MIVKNYLKKVMPSLSSVVLVLVCFVIASPVRAVVPAPDGGYPGFNTAEGQNALFNLTTGVGNTAVGWFSLWSDTDGSYNTAVGAGTLLFNVGNQSTGEGAQNTALGTAALLNNTTGSFNTATGTTALVNNTEGVGNTAVGGGALFFNDTGKKNTAIGLLALINNTEGGNNTAVGRNALQDNETGSANTAIGYRAGLDVTGDNNVCIGGAIGVAGVDNTTWIANVNTLTQNFSAGVNDYATVRLSDGRLGHTAVVSSQRYKHDIKALAADSKVLYELKPVSFRLKKEYDPTQALGFGLIAEEVEKVNGNLVYRNDKGQVESVRYEMVNAMLLNEFLKEHHKGEEQDSIAELRSEIRSLAAMVNDQASQLREVSAQLQISNAAAQEIASNRQ
jgi:hypothetical protein